MSAPTRDPVAIRAWCVQTARRFREVESRCPLPAGPERDAQVVAWTLQQLVTAPGAGDVLAAVERKRAERPRRQEN